MTYVVGLTGGIGSGKTTVSDWFAKQGIDIVDADIIAREVVEPGSAALAAIIDKFGKSIIDEHGALNRQALRAIVFEDKQQKDWLNNLLHPAIRDRMQQRIAQVRSPYAILSVPLLVENKLTSMVDRVLVVDVEPLIQQQRTSQRDGVPVEQVQAIMASQATREDRLGAADDVIDNSRDHSYLVEQMQSLHTQYLQLATKTNSSRA
ncbi:dephospho-CoA kinase [Aestuariibacter salexigens]|uniref:dephospho-CoA kinase n=1 Tax=Aestuariibacter salexigens TaxID=226010 RepID=UPI0003FD873D|nr:dephospho-CoA kinase [Aestuariibacter salexigens]